jgi:transcriptional regulator with XRE-family HTH domain
MSMSGTPGGKRLRALRNDYGKTQLAVELDANLGTGYLQRLETGKVQQPERDTLFFR